MGMLLKLITVIDLKIGNIASVSGALKYLGITHKISDARNDIESAEKLIFPGVGNFSEAAKRIRALGIDKSIRKKVLEEKMPILGICLGMQLFANYGEEGGISEGLGLIKGKISYHRAADLGLRLPHIGWNEVSYKNFKLFDSIENNSCFYFVHSYEMVPEETLTIAYSDYGVKFVAAVRKDNIVGVQFHPEKSQKAGLKLLDNFCRGII